MSNYSIDNYYIMESKTIDQWREFQIFEAQDNENLKLQIQAILITYKNQLIKNLKAFQLLEQIDHPNIMKIYYSQQIEHEKQIIITEKCSTKLNKHFLFETNRNNFTKGDALRFIYQISSGFVKLHENNISLSDFSQDTILIKREKDNQITFKLFGHFLIFDESLIKISNRQFCYEFAQILKSLFSILNSGDQDINDIINQLSSNKDVTWKKLKEQVYNLLKTTSNEDQMKKIEVFKPQEFRYQSQNNVHQFKSMIIPKHQQQTRIPKNYFLQSTNINKNCQTIQPVLNASSSQSLQRNDTQVNNQSLNHYNNQYPDFQQSQNQDFGQFDILPKDMPSGKINIPNYKYTHWNRVPPNKFQQVKYFVENWMKSQQIQKFE